MQNKLYEQFAPEMFALCLRYAKNRNDAEEILQEGFIKVFTCLDQYRFRGVFRAWIKKIMINCALQRLRNKNSMYRIIPSDTITDECCESEFILDRINAKELISLVQSLPTMYRLVFNLYVFEGFKHREIAELLHITEGTSKSNLYDARMLLQKKLQQRSSFVNINTGA